ncbi:MAG TPA: hypothetical protein VKB40_10645 [Candidatus Acidoferrales bacterium]|nr:hypothetical protein [Candidatus Acidoferrales bacterium]
MQKVRHSPRGIQTFCKNRGQIGDDLIIRMAGEVRVGQYLGGAQALPVIPRTGDGIATSIQVDVRP